MQKELKVLGLSDIKPYENNPRHNEQAVEAVKESIKQCQYIAPIIVDENGVILAGHTRYKALQELGKTEVEVMVVDGLTEEEKRKYRILDNKTNEFAGWNFDLLELELENIDFDGYDFGFNIGDDQIDIDSLFEDAPEKEPEEPKQIQCPHCGEWFTPE